jgi:hypothetical protein
MVLALCSAALIAAVSPLGARAVFSPHKTAYLTFSHAVRLPGVALGSGTYIFELASPDTTGGIVRVLSRDRTRSYFMGFTRPVARRDGVAREQTITLGESAPGAAPPVAVWWPDGDSHGRQFIYPESR